MLLTCCITLTIHVAVNPPSTVVAVTSVEPIPVAVTSPWLVTVQIASLELFHVTLCSVASSGVIMAVNCLDSPILLMVICDSSNAMFVTFFLTNTVHLSWSPVAVDVTTISVCPSLIAVTTPFSSTVATEVSSEVQLIVLSSASSGKIETDKLNCSVLFNVIECSLSVTDTTGFISMMVVEDHSEFS